MPVWLEQFSLEDVLLHAFASRILYEIGRLVGRYGLGFSPGSVTTGPAAMRAATVPPGLVTRTISATRACSEIAG